MTGPIVVNLIAADGARSAITVPQPVVASARPSGAGYARYEDLHVAGNTLTQDVARLGTSTKLTFPAGTFADADLCRPANFPVYSIFDQKSTAWIGSGVDQTIISVKPNTLTQAFKGMAGGTPNPYVAIEDLVEPQSNYYMLARMDKVTEWAQLTVIAADQGTNPKTGQPYSYNGVQFWHPVDLFCHHFKIKGVRGMKGVPPEETFALSVRSATGSWRIEDFEIDGMGVGSSAITWIGAPDIAIARGYVHDIPNGAPTTVFNQTGGSFTATDFKARNAKAGFNFEQYQSAKPIVLTRPDINDPSIGNPIIADSTAYSNTFLIYDPIGVDAAHPLRVMLHQHYGYYGVPTGPNKQLQSDFHLYINGVEHPELLKFTIG